MKLANKLIVTLFFIVGVSPFMFAENVVSPAEKYDKIQKELATGWNTWDTRSVLTHVLLPYGSAIDLNVLGEDNKRVNTFRIGGHPSLRPGARTYDGSYTDISVEWEGYKLRVQSAADGLNNTILVTPLPGNKPGGRLAVVPKEVWSRANKIVLDGNKFSLEPHGFNLKIAAVVNGDFIKQAEKEILMSADKPIVISCGKEMSISEAEQYINSKATAFVSANRQKYGKEYELYNAMQNVLAWDNIYDPSIRKVITPVSRNWNVGWSQNPGFGGFVLFCWDTYFAAMMLSQDNKELAYANAIEITNSITEAGFIPNFYATMDYKSRDRSQPPVGSLAIWDLYKRHNDKWLLELVYDKLLQWNRWWDKNRNINGLLCWGSNPYEKITYFNRESSGVNQHYGASLESGLDNTHMYDGVPFDNKRHMLLINDVGLSSLYVMDCNYLAKIAKELNRTKDIKELQQRSKQYSKNLAELWDEKNGLYYNRHTDSGKLNYRISPTNFYPLLANIPTQQQAKRMVDEHLLNPEEFGGEWIIPSTPRNDPAFKDNDYWRGRIWAPLNFLVYLGLCNYDLPEVRKELSEKSKKLLLKSWLSDGYVFENYNPVSGVGDDNRRSDRFYHWGALLSYLALIEEGF
ncbi:MGH1-like glycoside hydrolase domain-containing protein [Viscerimonas tarda]